MNGRSSMKITVIQLNSQEDKDANLAHAERLIVESHRRFRADLYVLPEYAPFGGGTTEQKFAAAEEIPTGKACVFFSRLAAKLGTTIHGGTVNEKSGDKMFNTSVVFGPNGSELCRYRKLFLFDAVLPSGREIRESKLYVPGCEIVTFTVGSVRFGCTICYDIRFPELYRALRHRGADVMIFVAAMSKEHGSAHLEVLLRARAIENQAYVIASQQCGKYFNNTRENYGNSMVVSPWGEVTERLENDPGYINCEIDLDRVHEVRRRIPLLELARKVAVERL